MKKKITVSQIKQVGEMWETQAYDLMKCLRGTTREFQRGFLSACMEFQALANGENEDAVNASKIFIEFKKARIKNLKLQLEGGVRQEKSKIR